MQYVTVFDIAEAGYKSASFPAFGLIFVFIGTLSVIFRRYLPSRNGRNGNVLWPFAFLSFAVIWTLGNFADTYRDYLNAANARMEGRAKVVEGQVRNFVPMPAAGHAMESFCVAVACFDYSDYVVTAGFNRTSSHGGPIREGLPVRITYLGNTIIKLEVQKNL